MISGFPNTYASKVGKTSDASYKACLADLLTTRSENSLSFRPAFPASCRCTAHHYCHPAAKIGGVLRACVVPLLQPSMHYTLQPGQGALVCCFAGLEHAGGRPNICLLGEESPCASLCASSSNRWSFLMSGFSTWVLCSRTRGEVSEKSRDVMRVSQKSSEQRMVFFVALESSFMNNVEHCRTETGRCGILGQGSVENQ